MFIILLLGLAVGVVSSLLGIGGGVFLVPFLPALTKWSPHQVVAFTLVIILGNSFFNLLWYNKKSLVSWNVLAFWGPIAALGSFAGSYLALQFEGRVLKLGLLAVVGLMILKFSLDFFRKSEDKKLFTSSDWSPFKSYYALFVGMLSGFCGVGTGLVSNMIFMSKRWVYKENLAPTGNGVMFFVSLSSLIAFLMFGAGRDIDFNFVQESSLEALILLVSVFLSSFFLRPFNSFISDKLRYSSLMFFLVVVFIYVGKDLLN